MPYVESESLRARLHRRGELPIGEAVRILREVRGRPALLRKNALDPRSSMTTRRRRVYWWNQLTLFGWRSYR